MKCPRSVSSLIVLCCILSVTAFSQNKKLDKALKKVDGYYASGNLPKATKALKKFKSGAEKLTTQGNYMVDYYIREAKLNLTAGILTGFDASLTNALSTSEKNFGATSTSYANTLIDVAEIHNDYGNYRVSHDYLEKSRSILDRSGQLDDAFKTRIALVKAEALIGQGFFGQGIALLRATENYLAARAVEKETFVEGTQIKTKRIPEEELPKRFGDYAECLTLIGNAYGKRGDQISSDSAFLAAHNWMRKNSRFFGESNLYSVRAHFLQAKILADNNNGMVPEEVEKFLQLDNILSAYKNQANPTSSLAHEIYLTYLAEQLEKGNSARYHNIKGEYEKILSKYFSRNSIVHANLSAIEFSAKLHKDKTRNLQSGALTMLNSKAIPKNYRTTERILEFLAEVAMTEKQYTNAESYLKQITEIKKELYGEASPEYHLSQIKLANFYLDFTNNIETAGKIYDESYYKVVSKEIGPWHKDHLVILNHLAKYFEITDNYQRATATLDKASDVARSKYDDKDPDYGIALDNIAQLQLKVGQYEKAEENITKSLKILEELRKDEERVTAYIQAIETQAKLFGLKGLFDEAQSNLDRTRKMIRKSDLAPENVSSAQELSTLYIQLSLENTQARKIFWRNKCRNSSDYLEGNPYDSSSLWSINHASFWPKVTTPKQSV
jgi:tetratricopeptide (TPR) repeat protein